MYTFTEYKRIKFGNYLVVIKPGFRTDFASIPRIFGWLFKMVATTDSAVCHDAWYCLKKPKKIGDKLFCAKLIEDGTNVGSAVLWYYSVRIFGILPFSNVTELDKYNRNYCEIINNNTNIEHLIE